ncbi:MAG: tRNA (N(6)-L-threonylcarbamoyladenosine(37)-C(2))-methylthiotransferase MtaB [Candidatus Omnitrophota bacterium]|nr:tRNA (N(6)-L-threonylcarbamoyladenosine(37)-C(2))-methylthiotransferase MtaB [Candidatus Omnitrophota bacterium]
MKEPKFAIKTLGCKVNQYEEQVLRENLQRFGFSESEPRTADIFIVNSCTVTGKADLKTRRLIRQVKRGNPEIKIFVTGCYAVFEKDIERLSYMPEVFKVIPAKDKLRLPVMIKDLFGIKRGDMGVREQISRFNSHSRAFLKIQDGCDQNCAYCKVSLVRGPSRCRDEREVIGEVTRLSKAGYREIVLTGICLGSWKGSKGQSISRLLKEMDGMDGMFRIRLSSIEPDLIDDLLIGTIAGSRRICRHLHIPLQSGSDRVLKRMNRRYDTERFRELIRNIRGQMPFAGITMDIITGFPGEDGTDFYRTMMLVKETKPSRLHVFKYSDREGTRSFDLEGKVHVRTAKERAKRLIEAGKELQAGFCRNFAGRRVEVLVEKKNGTMLEGYTGEYVRARMEGYQASEGDLISIEVNDIDEETPCVVNKKGSSLKI